MSVWDGKKATPARALPQLEIKASTNIQAAEVPQASQTLVEPVKHDPAPERRKLRAGALAQPERGVAEDIDGRTLKSTGRVLPLQLTVDDAINYWFRAEACRRRDQKLGHHKLSDLFLLCLAAYKREQGLE